VPDRTAIEWTEATWNPVTGCTKVSTGCKFCYAERITERWGQRFTEIKLHQDRLMQPLQWRKPRRIFVNSMSDLFHEEIPLHFLAEIFNVMACATLECGKRHHHEEECWTGPPHIFQILTKRPGRMLQIIRQELPNHVGEFWPGDSAISLALEYKWPLPNVWLGVSVENQEQADKRIPVLLQTPAAVRFLSVEPLLGPVDLSRINVGSVSAGTVKDYLDWVIVGGESGGPWQRALVDRGGDIAHLRISPRPEALEWVRSLRDQCVAAGVPFFFKQWGGPSPSSGGRMLDGRTWDEYPRAVSLPTD
jgi:protein gp37